MTVQLRASHTSRAHIGKMEASAASVRLHHGGPQGAKLNTEVIANIPAAIRERRV